MAIFVTIIFRARSIFSHSPGCFKSEHHAISGLFKRPNCGRRFLVYLRADEAVIRESGIPPLSIPRAELHAGNEIDGGDNLANKHLINVGLCVC